LFSSVDLATGEITPFPEPVPGYSPALLEPDLSHLLRVHYVGDQRLVTVLDLATGQTAEVGTVPEQYRQAGRPLLSPDGKRLVYSAAVGTDPEGDQFAIYEINLGTGEQHALLADQPVHYIPVVFEEDGSLLVVIAWLDTGTARLYPDGTLEQVSGLTYLGRMP
jgi:Tol biopolymer transport system component